MNSIFNTLRASGGYSVPYLIRLHDKDNTVQYYFINDNRSLVYDGHTYVASTFTYTPDVPLQGADGGGRLEIQVVDNLLIEALETFSTLFLEAVGVLLENGSVEEIKTHRHKYGEAVWQERTLTLSFEADDRMNMTWPALIFSTYNNRGNA